MDYIATLWDSVISVLATFRITDAIDILLLTYLIYKGIQLIRETRAQQLLKGILLFAVASVVANILSLNAMSYLLRKIFDIGVIAVVVLFQLVTLPVKFNASSRAMKALRESGVLTEEELSGARKVLTAAAMTYVAALFLSLMSFLRLLLIVGGRRRND